MEFRDILRLLLVSIVELLLLNSRIVSSLNPVLNLNETFPYLINKTTGEITQPRDYIDFDNLYSPSDLYKDKATAQSRNYHLLKAFDFANYYQSDYWHYTNREDLKRSAEPVANKSLCSLQLNWLESQVNSTGALWRPGEQHINLMTLVDSFGRPESNTYLGHGYWLGSYYECTRNSIDVMAYELEECKWRQSCHSTRNGSNGDELKYPILKSRYCIGKVRELDWPNISEDNYTPRVSYKVGLCLPETCETLSFEDHRDQIQRLMRFNLPEYMSSRMILHDIYCLPDPRSPIRELPSSSRVFLGLCALWLLLLTSATVIFSSHKRHQQDLRSIFNSGQMLANVLELGDGVKSSHEVSVAATQGADRSFNLASACCLRETIELSTSDSFLDLSKENSLEPSAANRQKTQTDLRQLEGRYGGNNMDPADKLLKGSTRETRNEKEVKRLGESSSSLVANWISISPKAIRILQSLSIIENLKDFQQPPVMLREAEASKRLRVNLNALDSIKCLCCILVIFGHIVFVHMQHLSNIVHTIELSSQLYPRVLIALFNFVDTFFIISGMLTAYFIFKRFNKETFENPLVWMQISLLRLLRLSPVYILAFCFSKTISVYLADGPIWDYGTDKNSNKGLCINDHWWKSLLYLGNLNTMQPLCILPAWSIIVDSQYSLLMPVIIYLLFRHRRTGYLVLSVAVFASTANMSFMLANQTAVKHSDMAKVRLHVYPLISRFAAEFYNTAWNRIGPVAVGILGGHQLYLYDVGRVSRWPWFMKGAMFKLVMSLHALIFLLPTIGQLSESNEHNQTYDQWDILVFITSNATIKPIWSIINTIFILRLVTDLRKHSVLARLMSHNLWHCAGKLCFASYLIHYEIILILLKSRAEGLLDVTWSNCMREFGAAFLISTLAAYFIHTLYESPINKLVNILIVGDNYKRKQPKEMLKSNTIDVLSGGSRNGQVMYSNVNVRETTS